ncbi:MAG: hypothetical protein V3V00_16375 [Saprospiraceae bacterium]
MKKSIPIALFAFKKIWLAIKQKGWLVTVLISLFLIIFLIILCCQGPDCLWVVGKGISDTDLYSKILDPLIGVSTFLVAVLIGLKQITSEWEDSLEKRLSVVFLYHVANDEINKINSAKYDTNINEKVSEKKIEIHLLNNMEPDDIIINLDKIDKLSREIEVLRRREKSNVVDIQKKTLFANIKFENNRPSHLIPLIIYKESLLNHESDIRAWSQQLGAQATGGPFLSFLPYQYNGETEIIERQKLNGEIQFIKHYIFFYYLREIPPHILHIQKMQIFTENYDETPAYDASKCQLSPIESLQGIDAYKNLSNYIDKKINNEKTN